MSRTPLNWFHKHQEQMSWSDKLGLKITSFVGTMLCAGIFTVIALVSLPAILTQANIVHGLPSWMIAPSLILVVSWIAQTFIQLVLLSIIMVGQNQQADRDKIQAEHQYEHQEKELTLQTQILNEQSLELALQTRILRELRKKG